MAQRQPLVDPKEVSIGLVLFAAFPHRAEDCVELLIENERLEVLKKMWKCVVEFSFAKGEEDSRRESAARLGHLQLMVDQTHAKSLLRGGRAGPDRGARRGERGTRIGGPRVPSASASHATRKESEQKNRMLLLPASTTHMDFLLIQNSTLYDCMNSYCAVVTVLPQHYSHTRLV